MNSDSSDPSAASRSKLGQLLISNRWAKIAELLAIFLIAFAFIKIFIPLAGENPVTKQVVVWFANILLLFMIWIGQRLRGETFKEFGLIFRRVNWRYAGKTFGWSILVFILAIVGFIIGSIIMANITGIPEGADHSGYDYLKGNLGMFMLTIAGALIVSSFGEEVIYRGFLINRFIQLGLNSRRGQIVAVMISAIIFGLVHYEWGPMGIVQTAFMGLALGLSYIYLKKRLWIMIMAHAYMDIILMTQMYIGIQ